MSIQHMQMVFDAGDLTSGEKSVLLAYCNFTDPHGYCWPGVERIADMTGISPRTIKRTRAALTERGLLGSKRRLTKTGQSITSMTRVNLDMLASLKRPPREYDDNVIEEITFAAPDQGTCHSDTPMTSEGATVTPPWGHHGPGEGDTVAPNPSGEPSGDPSSSSTEPADATDAVAEKAPKKTKTSPENIVMERLDCTHDEARAVVDHIEAQGDHHGNRIRSLSWWVTNREDRALAADLAHVRRHTGTPPTGAVCSEHKVSLAPGYCSACEGDMTAGDHTVVQRILERDGATARPDLARRLQAPQTSTSSRQQRTDDLFEGAFERARAREVSMGLRPKTRGGVRAPIITEERTRELAAMSNEEALQQVL